MDNSIKIGIALIVAGLIGLGAGYRLTPVKVVTKTEVKAVHVVDKNTITIIVKKPDGTTITHIINKDKIHDDSDSHTVTVKDFGKPDWMVTGGMALKLNNFNSPVYYGSLSRRVIGNIYVGVYGSSDKSAGLGVTLVF